MDQRHERIYVETGRHRIAGTVTLAKDGYRSRLTDHLNAVERDFISLTDATVQLIGDDGPGSRHDVLTVNRSHVVLVIPLDAAGAQAA